MLESIRIRLRISFAELGSLRCSRGLGGISGGLSLGLRDGDMERRMGALLYVA